MLNMVGSKQFNKLKATPKISLGTRQAEVATPTSQNDRRKQ